MDSATNSITDDGKRAFFCTGPLKRRESKCDEFYMAVYPAGKSTISKQEPIAVFAHHRLLFLGRLGQGALLAPAGGVLGVDVQAVRLVVEFDAVVVGENLVAAMLLAPFGGAQLRFV